MFIYNPSAQKLEARISKFDRNDDLEAPWCLFGERGEMSRSKG